jgi:uncharacterized paraquat-inducible protein A
MTNSPATEAQSDQPTNAASKLRQCLRCQAVFHSEWAGERICSRCKRRPHGGTARRLGPVLPAAADNGCLTGSAPFLIGP